MQVAKPGAFSMGHLGTRMGWMGPVFFFSGRPGGFGGSRRANKYQDPTAEGKIHSTQSDVRRVPGPLRGSQAQTDAMIAAPDEPFPVLLGGRVSGDVSDVAKRILSFDFCRLIVGAAGW